MSWSSGELVGVAVLIVGDTLAALSSAEGLTPVSLVIEPCFHGLLGGIFEEKYVHGGKKGELGKMRPKRVASECCTSLCTVKGEEAPVNPYGWRSCLDCSGRFRILTSWMPSCLRYDRVMNDQVIASERTGPGGLGGFIYPDCGSAKIKVICYDVPLTYTFECAIALITISGKTELSTNAYKTLLEYFIKGGPEDAI
jgi:hypothetical protein